MNDSKTTISLICGILIIVFRFIESKFILKEKRIIKLYLQDFVIGFVSCMASMYLYEMINPYNELIQQTEAFISEPDF